MGPRALLALLAALGACAAELAPPIEQGSAGSGGADDPNQGSGGDGLTMTQYLKGLAALHCSEAFNCRASYPMQMGGATFEAIYGTNVADCNIIVLDEFQPAVREHEVAAGHIVYDGKAAARCIAGITFDSCDMYWSSGPHYPDICYHVEQGTIANGNSCTVDDVCVSGHCDGNTKTCVSQ